MPRSFTFERAPERGLLIREANSTNLTCRPFRITLTHVYAKRSARAPVAHFCSVQHQNLNHIHAHTLSVYSTREIARTLCAHDFVRSVRARIIDRNIIFIESSGHTRFIDRSTQLLKKTNPQPKGLCWSYFKSVC